VGDGIFVIQPAGGTAEEVSPYGDQPSFNPTGNKIVFRKMSGVWLATRS
jgi:hypothetical protein